MLYSNYDVQVVDDLIPCLDDSPLFTHSQDQGEVGYHSTNTHYYQQSLCQVWPCLLEKAYAKLQGSYWHLKGGNCLSAMVDLTGIMYIHL